MNKNNHWTISITSTGGALRNLDRCQHVYNFLKKLFPHKMDAVRRFTIFIDIEGKKIVTTIKAATDTTYDIINRAATTTDTVPKLSVLSCCLLRSLPENSDLLASVTLTSTFLTSIQLVSRGTRFGQSGPGQVIAHLWLWKHPEGSFDSSHVLLLHEQR